MARRRRNEPAAKVRGIRRPEELPSGKWRGWTWNAVTQRKGTSKTFATFTEADAWMRAEQSRCDGHYSEAGVPVERNRRRRSFAEYAAHWAATSTGVQETTRTDRIRHARVLGRQWPDLMVDEIDRPLIKSLMGEMEAQGLAPGTRRNRLTALRNIFGEAILDGLREDDPTRTIDSPPRITLRVHRVPSAAELDALLASAPEWLRPALLLMQDAGLRISEVCGLRWSRLDLLHGTVTVADVVVLHHHERGFPKGKRVLSVPLTPRLLTALREHQKRYPGGPNQRVFREPRRNADHVAPARLRNLFDRAVRDAGIAEPYPWPHDLRHGCGHALAAAGTPMHVIAAILRHRSIATSQTYLPTVSDREARRWLDATQESSSGEHGGNREGERPAG